MRASASVPPPGGNGTMKRTGFSGKRSCAKDGSASAQKSSTASRFIASSSRQADDGGVLRIAYRVAGGELERFAGREGLLPRHYPAPVVPLLELGLRIERRLHPDLVGD